MTYKQKEIFSNHIIEIAVAFLFLASISYIGSSRTLIALVMGSAAVACLTFILERRVADREHAGELSRQPSRWTEKSRREGAWKLSGLAFAFLLFAEFYWYRASHEPLANIGNVIVTNPTEWALANAVAVAAALVAWRRSPEWLRPFFVPAAAGIALGTLLISTVLPHLLG